jgi:hypothetical protein
VSVEKRQTDAGGNRIGSIGRATRHEAKQAAEATPVAGLTEKIPIALSFAGRLRPESRGPDSK